MLFGRNAFFVASLLPQALLVLIRDLKGLSVFSLLADVANIFAFLVVFWFDFKTIEDEEITAKAFKWDGLPFILGVAIYCYEGAGMILSLEQSVPSDHRDKFPRLLTMALASITLLYVVFGSCGYASFGENTEKIITLNMPPGILPNLVKGCLCFSLLFTLPGGWVVVCKVLPLHTTTARPRPSLSPLGDRNCSDDVPRLHYPGEAALQRRWPLAHEGGQFTERRRAVVIDSAAAVPFAHRPALFPCSAERDADRPGRRRGGCHRAHPGLFERHGVYRVDLLQFACVDLPASVASVLLQEVRRATPVRTDTHSLIGSRRCALTRALAHTAAAQWHTLRRSPRLHSSQTRTRRLGNYALMALGIVSMIVGLADVLERIMNPNGAGDSIHGV